MSESLRALCSDFYVNLKLGVKMELPRGRETVLEFFERVRRQFPAMNHFRRYRDELALESPQTDSPHRWVAARSTSVRSGTVNPPDLSEAYLLHRLVLEVAPYYMSISPLDVDFIELLFGFDLMASGNHDAIVHEALLAGSPLGKLAESPLGVKDCQPSLGFTVGRRGDIEAQFEVKTRTVTAAREGEGNPEPISVYLTLRKLGSVTDLKELGSNFDRLASVGEELAESRVVPTFLVPLRDAIASGRG
ncbi:MAG: hypothetical protein JNL50_00075 [Phycisphaerae bacterium]|nr:hypothetical protein [Phycisphaerae bacterium]